jgi:RNA polymerase sigma factor (sigma-70 family)
VRRLGVDARNPEVIDELKRKDDVPKETARDSDLLTTFALRRPLAWPVNFVRAAKRTAVLIRLSFGWNRFCWIGKAGVMGMSFEAVFEAEFAGLNRYLRRRVGASVADDLSAETFATAYANWDRFDQSRPVRAWLYGIAANLLRHRTGVDPVLVEFATDGARLDAAASYRSVASDIAALRRTDREILLMHAWAELSDREIAEALGLPIGTVKSRLHRMRGRLRNRIERDGQSEKNRPIAATPEE